MSRSHLLLSLALLPLACDGSSPSAPSEPASPASEPALQHAAVEGAGPVGDGLSPFELPSEMPAIERPAPAALSVFVEGGCAPDLLDAGEHQVLSTGPLQQTYLLADGKISKDPLPFVDDEEKGVYYWGEITEVGGEWPEDGWLGLLQVERAYEHETYLRFRDGKLAPVAGVSDDRSIEGLYRWGEGLLAYTTCSPDMDARCKVRSSARFQVIEGDRPAPRISAIRQQVPGSCSFVRLDDVQVEGDEIHALGRTCGWDDTRPTQVFYAHWDGAGALDVQTLAAPKGLGEDRRWPDLDLDRAADGALWARVTWDRWEEGTSQLWRREPGDATPPWREVPIPGKGLTNLQVSPTGEAWILADDGGLWRTEGAHWVREASETHVSSLGGVEEGRPVVVADGDRLLERTEDGWVPLVVPRPAYASGVGFELDHVEVHGEDVWVSAHYAVERRDGEGSFHRSALLTSAEVDGSLRCGGPLGTDDGRPVPWPEAADESCETPMALLSFRRSWAREDTDYPGTRRALGKGDAEAFGVYELMEFELGGHHVLGARTASVEAGRAMVDHIDAEMRGVAPELVCMEAPAKVRPIVVAQADVPPSAAEGEDTSSDRARPG